LALKNRAERIEIPVVVEPEVTGPVRPARRTVACRVIDRGVIDARTCLEQVRDGRLPLYLGQPVNVINGHFC
jgi:hypothetical protein